MVLRCSLLGHDYGEPDVEREREERGSEVVVTVQEYEECVRCGDRHLISENTEVRSLPPESNEHQPEDDSADERPDEPDVPTEPDADEDGEFVEDDAELVVDSTADADPVHDPDGEEPQPEGSSESDLPTDEHGDPITDDGVILEDDDDEPGPREPGEWPESDDVGPPLGAEKDPTDWPEPDPDLTLEDVSTEAELEATGGDSEDEPIDDAVIVDGEDESRPIPGTGAGTAETAEANARPGGLESGTGIERAGSAPTPGEAAPLENVPTEFYCPRCSFVAPGNRGSLRTGDICPECRRGYLGERER